MTTITESEGSNVNSDHPKKLNKEISQLRQFIVDQHKVIQLFEKISQIVSLRFAELIGQAIDAGRYFSVGSPTSKAGSGKPDWDTRFNTAFDQLVAQETKSK